MSNNIKLRTDVDIQSAINDAWLGLNPAIKDNQLYNPIANIPTEFDEEPHLYLTWLMMQPDYFSFLCNNILNVKLLPFQALILKTLYNHKFPMFIGSRGLSKCITGNSLLISKNGICRLQSLIDHDIILTKQYKEIDLLGNNGFNKTDYFWSNGSTKTIKIESDYGFKLEGTLNHPILAVKDNKIQDINLEDLKLNDYILIDRTDCWFDGHNELDVDEAYLLGLIVGDGGYTVRGRISFTTADKELANSIIKLSKRFFGKSFKQSKVKYTYNLWGVDIWDKLFQYYGFNSSICGKKAFPTKILSANKDCMKAFIQGIMDTDGTAIKSFLGVGYCAKSYEMCEILQFILTKFGIISSIKARFNKKYNKYYYNILILGEHARIFGEKIGFRLKRKQKQLNKNSKCISNTNKDIIPIQLVLPYIIKLKQKYNIGEEILIHNIKLYNLSYNKLNKFINIFKKFSDNSDLDLKFLLDLQEKHYFFDKVSKLEKSENITYDCHIPNDHHFISNGFISHNSFLLAVYCWIRALTLPGRKIVIAGSTFRQSKVVFEYMEKIWNNAPILRNICSAKSTYGPKHDVDMWRFYIGDSVVNAIPIGPTGDNIRGLRAHDLIAEEFKSHNRDIFETVLVGFGAVSADPVENVQRLAAIEMAKKLNFKLEKTSEDDHFSNQLILSGTAYYQFNHFYDYWKRWKGIILTKGDKSKYETLFGEGSFSRNINYKDYCIIRIPIELAPDGFMDKDQIARSKATMHSGNYQCEYGCAWSTDSNGFFKRSLLEACTVSEKTDISFPSCKKVLFYPTLVGNKKLQYAIGVDPASEEDNFAIKVLELHPDHRRIVYGWTITKKEQKARLSEKTISENDFYTFCARKIRELMKHFPTAILGIDSQGGGYALMEALLRVEEPGDLPIYEIIDYNDPKETDGFHGLHIIKKIQFADSQWMSEANNSLRLAFEQKTLLFPHNDALSTTFAELADKSSNRLYDTLEDCIQDIEELKDELSTIIMTSTDSGRDKWTTPDRKEPGMKKGKMRKDRYTALLIANSVADFYLRSEVTPQQTFIGGFAHNTSKKDDVSGPEFVGPSWYVEQMRGLYD